MDGVKQLGRWFSLGTGGGFRLVETDNPAAIACYKKIGFTKVASNGEYTAQRRG